MLQKVVQNLSLIIYNGIDHFITSHCFCIGLSLFLSSKLIFTQCTHFSQMRPADLETATTTSERGNAAIKVRINWFVITF
jgi:hypothetical protein